VNELLGYTLVELTEALRLKRASPVELMEATLARIDETNPKLNAVVAMYEREKLLAAARVAADRIARGEARALEGVPLGVKDLEDAEGLVTSHGSLPFKDQVATRDSTQVARLRAAGAIVVGKTNAPEFGYAAVTKNLVYGVTRNPWDIERTPGGSSGGSAAALAAGALPLVTASDGGGSIRIPASFIGAFGLKPSFGRVPKGPMERWVYDDNAGYGPLTKTVEDGALLLDQVVGPSPCDPKSLPHPGISYLETVRAGLPEGLRIAYSADLGYAIVQSDIAETVSDAARVFEKLGQRVEEIQGGPPPMGREWALLGAYELAAELHHLLPEHEESFGRTFLRGIKTAWDMTPEKFGACACSSTAGVPRSSTSTICSSRPPCPSTRRLRRAPTRRRPRAGGSPSGLWLHSPFPSTSPGIRLQPCAPVFPGWVCPWGCRSWGRGIGTMWCCKRRAPSSASDPGTQTGPWSAR
jgi:aspartyl-tRNA(Asn)/glutamyl-tRNA(Gln) amidotransferase subunit A